MQGIKQHEFTHWRPLMRHSITVNPDLVGVIGNAGIEQSPMNRAHAFRRDRLGGLSPLQRDHLPRRSRG